MLKKISLVVAAMSLTACATNSSYNSNELSLPNSNALDELVKVSIESRDELRLLAKTQESVAQKVLTKEQKEQRFIQAVSVPSGFEVRGDFKYSGNASSATKALAMAAGYKYMETGHLTGMEPWVDIFIKDEPLNEALRELGMQIGDAADVSLHAKVIQYTHH